MIINWYNGHIIVKKEVKNIRHKNVYMLNINDVTYYTCGLSNNYHTDKIMNVEFYRNKVWYYSEVCCTDDEDAEWDDYSWQTIEFTEQELHCCVFAKDRCELEELIINPYLTEFLQSEDKVHRLVTVSCLFPSNTDRLKNSGFYKDYTFYDIEDNLTVGDVVCTCDTDKYNGKIKLQGYVKSIQETKISPKANKLFRYKYLYRPVKKIDVVDFTKYKNIVMNNFQFLPKSNCVHDEIPTYVYMLGLTWKAYNIEKFIIAAKRVAKAFDDQSKEYDDIRIYAEYTDNINFNQDNARTEFIRYALTKYYNLGIVGKDFKYMEMNI